MPAWLLLICGVCLFIPLARLATLLFTAALCLIQPARVAARPEVDKLYIGTTYWRISGESCTEAGLIQAEPSQPKSPWLVYIELVVRVVHHTR
jgi:hypothetical protein